MIQRVPDTGSSLGHEVSCRACGNGERNGVHTVLENMLGIGDEHRYIECGGCGSLSLERIPDVARYYPQNYYSFSAVHHGPLYRHFRKLRDAYCVFGGGVLGAVLSKALGCPAFTGWMKVLGLRQGANVVDVGSGGGQLILSVADLGVRAMGVDPFIKETQVFNNGGTILKATLKEVTGSWDVIMFNHSLEHMVDPVAAVREAGRLSKRGARLLIRTPVAEKAAWREYGTHWFQLDAPRHVLIPSERALRRMTEENGFRLYEVTYDSTASQFWASEQYRQGISLLHETSYAVNPKKSIFSRRKIAQYQERAEILNALQDGDQGCFYFEKE